MVAQKRIRILKMWHLEAHLEAYSLDVLKAASQKWQQPAAAVI